MIALSSPEQTQLARRVSRVGILAQWTYDNSAGGVYTMNPTGMNSGGVFQQSYLRLEDLQFRARIPYLAEGIEFPSFNATVALPKINDANDLFWYDYTSALDPRAIARSPMVGGPFTIYSEVWHADNCATTQLLFSGRVNDIRAVGYPPRLEISGVSKYESMSRRHVDYSMCQGSEAGHTNARPRVYMEELLGEHGYDYCFADWSANDHPTTIQVRIFPGDLASLPDTVARLFYHGLGSPRINRYDLLTRYDWCQTTGRSTDATITAADIVPDSAALIPRLDRLSNGLRLRGYNPYTLTPNHYSIGSGTGSGDGWFGSHRAREIELDWYDIGDADCCETIIYAAYTNAFDCSGPTVASVPTQFRCAVPFGVGVPLELGDCLAVKYEPCGMWGYSRWVVEEINFRLSTMTYDLIMHNRL